AFFTRNEHAAGEVKSIEVADFHPDARKVVKEMANFTARDVFGVGSRLSSGTSVVERANLLSLNCPVPPFQSFAQSWQRHPHQLSKRAAVVQHHDGAPTRFQKAGGRAIVMLYNRSSFRQLVRVTLPRLRERLKGRHRAIQAEEIRALYDTSSTGEAAPHTEYVTRREVRHLFDDFSRVRMEIRNFDALHLPRRVFIPREKC